MDSISLKLFDLFQITKFHLTEFYLCVLIKQQLQAIGLGMYRVARVTELCRRAIG